MGVEGAGSGSSNFSQLYDKIKNSKNINQAQAQELVNEALKDGSLNKEEREALFEVGMHLEDKKTFDPSKLKSRDGAQPVDTDVNQMFEMGMKARKEQKEDEKIGRDAARYANDDGKVTYTNVVKSGLANAADGAVSDAYGAAKWVADKTGVKDFLKNHFSGTVNTARSARDGVAGWNKDFGISEKEKASIQRLVDTEKKIGTYKADTAFTFNAFENVQCVDKALEKIHEGSNEKWNIPQKKGKGLDVSEGNLKKWTGKDWDGVNVSESKDLPKLLTPNKTLITDGGHAYVFKGIEGKKMTVYDPVTDKNKTFSTSNKSLTAFVQGKGDGSTTSAADATRNVMNLDAVKPMDEDKGDKSESFAIRKSLVFMSDPKEAKSFNDFKQKIEAAKNSGFSDQSIKELSNFLNSKGMGAISERDIRAMVNVLTTKVAPNDKMGGKDNLLDMFSWLNGTAEGAKSDPNNLTQNQTRVMSAIEYSNVNLDNFYSRSQDPKDKADKMANILNEMMEGKKGC